MKKHIINHMGFCDNCGLSQRDTFGASCYGPERLGGQKIQGLDARRINGLEAPKEDLTSDQDGRKTITTSGE